MDIALMIWAIALTVLVVVGVVWVLDLQARLRRMQRRNESLFAEEEDASVAAALKSLAARLSETSACTEQLMTRTQRIDTTLAHVVQGVGLVRFRAFQDTGGDQSFALALLDGEGDGVVISALYGRGATRVYAKPIQEWVSPKMLSEEEEKAVAQARLVVVGQD